MNTIITLFSNDLFFLDDCGSMNQMYAGGMFDKVNRYC